MGIAAPPAGWRGLAKGGLRRAFQVGQRLGVDVLPRHFYSSIPDIAELRETQVWREPRSLVGLAGFDLAAQVATLDRWFSPAVRERIGGRDIRAEASARNGAVGYGPVEAKLLHAFIASERPAKVVQVGAGVSTAVVLDAAAEAGHQVDVVCVDPFPTDFLRELAARGEITLIAEPAQEVELAALTDLADGDLLFVDSTHTVKPGSEVNRLVLEVLPRLGAGVWVHFHDILFPYDYSRDVLTSELFFWNESVLLHAFLVDNARFSTQLCSSWLHYEARDALLRAVPGYVPAANDFGMDPQTVAGGQFPSSTYLRVVASAADRT